MALLSRWSSCIVYPVEIKNIMIKCKKCSFSNIDGTNYCQRCGNYLNSEKKSKKRNFSFLAGNNFKEISIAPLAIMGLTGIAKKDADLQKIHKRKYVKVFPLENGDWYCPDCGEYNQAYQFHCKGCGREFSASC